jgi:hypothetical protein
MITFAAGADAVEFKAINGAISVDEAQGIVECFVAAVGNKDSVGDIIVPGAFNASLRRRKPRVVWGHDWNQPIGKVLEIYEVGPNDPRLPAKMKAARVGGLFARVQINLKSERGREAFSHLVFFGQEHEWCVDPETEILTDRGWLRYDEVTTDDLAYVIDPELGWGRFEPIQAVNVWDDKARHLRLIETGGHSSLTTAAHRWPLACNADGGKVRWTTTEELQTHDRIIRAAARADAPATPKYTDAFVELVGWFWTEGWTPPADHPDAGLYFAQSAKVNPQHVASMRAALQSCFPGQWSERHSKDDMATFRIKREAAASILEVTGADKEPTPEFLCHLTRAQLHLLIDTCVSGDGHETKSGQRTWYQLSDAGVRSFEMLCALAGQPTVTTPQKDYGNRYGRPPHRVSLLKSGVAKPLDAIRVKAYKDRPSRTPAVDEWVETQGIVWCPTTPSGTWLARRRGTVYFTGNSIGYKTLDAEYDAVQKANILKEVELYEVSPVLHGANQLTATISIKSDQGDERIDSFRKSKWAMFDRRFAEMIKEEHPEIWAAGGNIKGNDQYEILSRIAEGGGVATTPDQISALALREAWVARHAGDFRLPGVIAQMKWLAIGSRGEDHMKNVVRAEIERRAEAKAKGLDPDAYEEDEEKDGAGYPSMDTPDYGERLSAAIAAEHGGQVRLREVTRNLAVFDHLADGQTQTMRVSYHFDGERFMVGDPERVKPQTVYLPMGDPKPEVKGPQDALLDLPQERITGDVLRGYGPRRGNLERLLRYWRPIMKKPGGFRRCRVILANHPELYPLERICAWLHHETTGLWPNEGCHHPGMKNCRRKLRGIRNGSRWTDREFNARLSRMGDDKTAEVDDDDDLITDDDVAYANKVLADFIEAEADFVKYLGDDANWDHVGDDDDGFEKVHDWVKPDAGDKDCGCGGAKVDDLADLQHKITDLTDSAEKAGRVLSAANLAKITEAIGLLEQVVGRAGGPLEQKGDLLAVEVERLFEFKAFLDPVLDYHRIDTLATEDGLVVRNVTDLPDEAKKALASAVSAYTVKVLQAT